MELITNVETGMTKLILKLAEFGLNPREWLLIPLAKNQFQIVNRFDREFQMRGWTKPCGQSWQDLRLFSL